MDRHTIALVLTVLMGAALVAWAGWMWWNGRARSEQRSRAREDLRWRDKAEQLDDKAAGQD